MNLVRCILHLLFDWPRNSAVHSLTHLFTLKLSDLDFKSDSAMMHFKRSFKIGTKVNKTGHPLPTEDLFAKLLSSALGFDYSLMQDSKGELGTKQPDGSWSGLVGMVNRSEIDFAVTVVSLTEERLEASDWSYPYALDKVTFATWKPSYKTEWMSSLKPFSYAVWICFIASLVTVSLLFHVASKKRYDFSKVLLSNYGTFLQKDLSTYPPRKKSEYVIIAAWLAGTTFMTFSYSALLLSFLTIPTLSGVRTIPDLYREVAKGTYQCFGTPGAFLVDTMKLSDNPGIQIIGKDMENSRKTSDVESVLKDRSGSKTPVFIRARNPLEKFDDDYFISEDTFFNVLFAMPVKRSFCCMEELNTVVRRMWSAGLYTKLVQDDKFRSKVKIRYRPSDGNEETGPHRVLSLGDFKGAFVLLIIGHALSLAVFSMEKISVFVKSNRNH